MHAYMMYEHVYIYIYIYIYTAHAYMMIYNHRAAATRCCSPSESVLAQIKQIDIQAISVLCMSMLINIKLA